MFDAPRCRVEAPTTVLLYGPHGSGKSLLAAAVAGEVGATVFDLSPAATDGKYPGKSVDVMVNMVRKGGASVFMRLFCISLWVWV